MNILSRLFRNASSLCFLLLFASTACESSVAPEQAGSLQLSLLSTAENGDSYILQNTTINILQQSNLVTALQSDDLDVTETTLSADLLAGDYTSLLLEGWQVAQLNEDGTTTPMNAVLRDSPERPISISHSSTTTLTYIFDIPGETIVFGGTLEVGFEVNEEPTKLSGKAPGPCSLESDSNGDGIADYRYTFAYDETGREIESSTDWDADGVIDDTVFSEYDAMGRVIRTRTDDDGDGVIDQVETFTYDSNGNKINYRHDEDGDGIFDKGNDWQYNSNGKLIAEYEYDHPPFDTSQYSSRTTNEYDSEGRIILSESDQGSYGEPGDGIADSRAVHSYSEDGLLKTSEYEHNADGIVSAVDTATLNADGNPVEVLSDLDADGTVDYRAILTYDSEGRMLTSTFDVGLDGTIEQSTTYEYDDLGNEIYSTFAQSGVSSSKVSEYDNYGNFLKSTATSSQMDEVVTLADYSCFVN